MKHALFRIWVVLIVITAGWLILGPILDRYVMPAHDGRITEMEYANASYRNWLASGVGAAILIVLGIVIGGRLWRLEGERRQVVHVLFRATVVLVAYLLGGLVLTPIIQDYVAPSNRGLITHTEHTEAATAIAAGVSIVLGFAIGELLWRFMPGE